MCSCSAPGQPEIDMAGFTASLPETTLHRPLESIPPITHTLPLPKAICICRSLEQKPCSDNDCTRLRKKRKTGKELATRRQVSRNYDQNITRDFTNASCVFLWRLQTVLRLELGPCRSKVMMKNITWFDHSLCYLRGFPLGFPKCGDTDL